MKAGLGVGLGIRASLGSKPSEFGLEKPEISESIILVGLLPFTVIPLSYAIAPLSCAITLLKVENLSSSLGVAKSLKGFY